MGSPPTPATYGHAAQEGDLADDEDGGVDVGERRQDDPEADVHEAGHDLDGLRDGAGREWGQLTPPGPPGDGGTAVPGSQHPPGEQQQEQKPPGMGQKPRQWRKPPREWGGGGIFQGFQPPPPTIIPPPRLTPITRFLPLGRVSAVYITSRLPSRRVPIPCMGTAAGGGQRRDHPPHPTPPRRSRSQPGGPVPAGVAPPPHPASTGADWWNAGDVRGCGIPGATAQPTAGAGRGSQRPRGTWC